jgi:isocitrate/isopropylmalate dehydrogenase
MSTANESGTVHANGAGSHNYRIASIPADGIGPEVVSAAIELVETLAKTLKTFKIEFTHIPWGTEYYKKTGRYVDENVLDTLRGYDAALFGSVGAPGVFIWQ